MSLPALPEKKVTVMKNVDVEVNLCSEAVKLAKQRGLTFREVIEWGLRAFIQKCEEEKKTKRA